MLGFARTIRAAPTARFLSLNPLPSYLAFTARADWPYLTGQRSMLLGIEDAQGYNSIEPLRYWTYVRTVTSVTYPYNNSVVFVPPAGALDLLQVGWEVAPDGQAPSPGFVAVAREGRWVLYRRTPPPRASVVTRWVVESAPTALRTVAGADFQPESLAVIESHPDLAAGVGSPGAGSAVFRWLSPQSARIEVHTSSDGIVLVRNTFDEHWQATVDGRPAPVLRTDFFLQGVPVTTGNHTILLTFRDRSIGVGLAGSAVALALLLGGAGLAARRRPAPLPHHPA